MSQHVRNTSKMKECCFNGQCFDGFRDLGDRIANLSGEAMFHYMHENPEKVLIDKVPKGYKWSEYLFDYWDFTSQKDFMEEFTTTLDVNRYGNDKIYVNWRLLDKYKGHFRGHGLTRNMIDIRIYIPDRNLFLQEHFCFRYFARTHGSPDSLLRSCIKEGIGKLYDCYYVTTDYRVLVNRQSYHCYTGPCCHPMDRPVPDKVVNCLPAWYYKNTYPPQGQLKRVSFSDYILFIVKVVVTLKMADIPDYAFILFDDICDIIGPSDEWPLSILKMFWRPNTRHWERFILCTFVAVNGLNPEVFLEWIDVMSLARDEKALQEFRYFLDTFNNNS